MAKLLTLDEIIIALARIDPKTAGGAETVIVAITQELADILAARIGVDAGQATSWDGGIVCSFAPLTDDEPIPDELADFDTEADWEPRA